MQLTNRKIRQIHTALSMLSARTLPSIKNDLRVAKLRREFFAGPFEVTEDVRKKVIERLPMPEGDGEEQAMSASLTEARFKAIEAMLDDTQDVRDVPANLILTEADLPAAMKTNPENRAGIADFLSNLDFLYPLTSEEE